MAASRYNCEYLVKLHSFMFLEFRGDPSWLEDLSKAPPKLQKLAELNAVLAHQPWLLTDNLIAVTDRKTKDLVLCSKRIVKESHLIQSI